jgi:alpha-tubulin N-acetyltransferase 1
VDKILTTNHTIIVSYNVTDLNQKVIYGYLKYGIKDLFFYKKNGIISQSSPICLLDFYVDESAQRGGIGISLFKKMLEVQIHICFYLCISMYMCK